MSTNQEKLGKEKIPRLLFQQSMPAIIGFIVMSLYNVVDTIFIGRGVGTLGIGATAIAFPIQMISMALAVTIGIGAASIISRSLGSKRFNKAEETLGNFFSLAMIISIAFTVLGLVFLKPVLILFGATETILPYAVDYMYVIIIGTVFAVFSIGGNNIIRSEGAAKTAMIVMVASAVINTILDPIFIFGFGWGMQGAALATIIAQACGSIVVFYYFFKGRSEVSLHLRNLRLKAKTVKETFAIGMSSLARQVSGSLTMTIINHSLAFYGGDIAIAAYGIIFRIIGLLIMPMIGIVLGMQPIVGYNYGAKNYKRAKEAITLSVKSTTIISFAVFAIVMLFIKPVVMIFTTDPELIALTTNAGRIILFMTPIIGFQIVAGGMYQAMGKATKAFIMSILRQVIFLIPIALILPLVMGLEGLFYSFPLSDLGAGIITYFIMRKDMKCLKK